MALAKKVENMEKYKLNAHLEKELKQRNIEVQKDYHQSTNSYFRYFIFEGQKICIDDYNDVMCPVISTDDLKEIDNMIKILDIVKKGTEIYSDYSEIGGPRELDFVWGEKDSLTLRNFNDAMAV